jgi:indolepyruvate ferredoxin oxidoreductase alpha subunit
MSKILLSGDEAVAWGAIHAGCCISAAYPGTPASEIQETVARSRSNIPFYWSIN